MRIKIIDGYRTIAVLGVLWAHCWMFFGNPKILVAKIDIASFLSFFGTGVDLFFVISGFCMYLMYISKQDRFSLNTYLVYLKKRFLRIAPAFYAAIIVYAFCAANFTFKNIDWKYSLISAGFIRTFFPIDTIFAPHFWSLATEWHFYILLPLIVWLSKFSGFRNMVIITVLFSLIFRFYFLWANIDPFNIINYSIPNRIIEFLSGIVMAKLYLDKSNHWFCNSNFMIIVGFFIALAGRLLMTAYFQDRTDLLGVFSRVLNLPFLSLGYAIIIINSLNTSSYFSNFMGSPIMTFIGKYSYSMYLWHWVIAGLFCTTLSSYFKDNQVLGLFISFAASVLALIPLSMISFHLFESFYFKIKK